MPKAWAYKYTQYSTSFHSKNINFQQLQYFLDNIKFREKNCLTKQYGLRLGNYWKVEVLISGRLLWGPNWWN